MVVGDEMRWRLELTDTGRGIQPDLIESLFGAFEQGGRAITRHYGGLGLGLAICKGVVDLHGGRIWAESEGLDRGTTFIVELATAEVRQVSEVAGEARGGARRGEPQLAAR